MQAMRIFILFALVGATVALTVPVEASKKSAKALPVENNIALRNGKRITVSRDTVMLDGNINPNPSKEPLNGGEVEGDDQKTNSELETAVHKKRTRTLRRRHRGKVYAKKINTKKTKKIMKKKVTKKVKKTTKKVKKTAKKVKKTAKKVKKTTKKVKKTTKKVKKVIKKGASKRKGNYSKPRPRKRRRRRRRRMPIKKPLATWPPSLPPPPGSKVCPCRVVAKRAKECYSFTNEHQGLCKLRFCDVKWECVSNGWSKNLCIRKYATEVIEPLPGSYNKCRRRKHEPKPFWVFYRKIVKPKPKRKYVKIKKP